MGRTKGKKVKAKAKAKVNPNSKPKLKKRSVIKTRRELTKLETSIKKHKECSSFEELEEFEGLDLEMRNKLTIYGWLVYILDFHIDFIYGSQDFKKFNKLCFANAIRMEELVSSLRILKQRTLDCDHSQSLLLPTLLPFLKELDSSITFLEERYAEYTNPSNAAPTKVLSLSGLRLSLDLPPPSEITHRVLNQAYKVTISITKILNDIYQLETQRFIFYKDSFPKTEGS